MTRMIAVCAGALVLMTACGKEVPQEPVKADNVKPAEGEAPAVPKKEEPKSEPAKSDHGDEVALGHASVAGFRFEVSRLGVIEAGSDAAVAMKVVEAPEGKDWQSTNLYVWVEGKSGKLNAPEKAHVEGERLHAHASVPSDATEAPAALVLRVRDGDIDERTKVSLGGAAADSEGHDAHGHTHEATPHDGVVAKLNANGKSVGWLELKLHDDKGDLELWLAEDEAMESPLDLDPAASITVEFVDVQGRKVKLAPRNGDKNEDEDGVANMRDGKTNYFIFPGDSGADASWLQGKQFQSIVEVAVEAGDTELNSDELVLRPHTHHDGDH